jgi:hypothetical protein
LSENPHGPRLQPCFRDARSNVFTPCGIIKRNVKTIFHTLTKEYAMEFPIIITLKNPIPYGDDTIKEIKIPRALKAKDLKNIPIGTP